MQINEDIYNLDKPSILSKSSFRQLAVISRSDDIIFFTCFRRRQTYFLLLTRTR
jgi:hypothetical protein